MASFYRKERDIYFRMRFQAPSAARPNWSLKGATVFQAKKASKVVVIDSKRVTCRVNGLAITLDGITPRLITINEADIPKYLDAAKVDLASKVIKRICKDHATSSSSSILISGCLEDNFKASTTYPGYKLRIDLKTRVPFSNPFVSGLEKECFLVGSVTAGDCEGIRYFGETSEELDLAVDLNVRKGT